MWSVEAYLTELRGFGAGFTQSMARVMSATVVFLIPVLMDRFGYIAIAPFALVYLAMFLLVLTNPWLSGTSGHLEEISADEPQAV